MLVFITAENGLPFWLLSEIGIVDIINSPVTSVLRHKILIYFTWDVFKCGISYFIYIMSSRNTSTGILPNCKAFLYCFLFMLKQQRIWVWLCKPVLFVKSCHIDIKFCRNQNRSTAGCSKLKRSVDMTSSGKNGLSIKTSKIKVEINYT